MEHGGVVFLYDFGLSTLDYTVQFRNSSMFVLLLSNIKKNQTRPPHMAFGMLLRKQFEKVQLAEGFWVLSRKKPGSSFLEAVHTSIYDFYDNAWRKWERHFQGVSLINRSHDRVPFRFWCVKPSFPWNLHIATAQTPYFFDLSDIENHCPKRLGTVLQRGAQFEWQRKTAWTDPQNGLDWLVKTLCGEDPRIASF